MKTVAESLALTTSTSDGWSKLVRCAKCGQPAGTGKSDRHRMGMHLTICQGVSREDASQAVLLRTGRPAF